MEKESILFEDVVKTAGKLHNPAGCMRSKCWCLAPWEEIKMWDMIFRDNATWMLYPDYVAWRQFIWLSMSCVCNDSEDRCIAIEWQKAHLDETEFAIPLDDAEFEPVGTQFYNFTEWYPTFIDTATASPTCDWMWIQMLSYYDKKGCPAVRYGVFTKIAIC